MHSYNYYVPTQLKFNMKSSFKGHYINFYLKITYFGSPVKFDFDPYKE